MTFVLQHHHDYKYALILGVISGFFLFLAEWSFGLGTSYYLLTLLGLPLLALAGIAVSKAIFYKVHPVWQFSKFFLIGVTNTLINFGILDFLVHVSGVKTGPLVSFFGAISFTASMVNSYIWNSHWSFHNRSLRTLHEFARFFLVTFIGLSLNMMILTFIINYFAHPGFISPEGWVNVANVIAALIIMFWSFFAYKYMVFENQVEVHTLNQEPTK